jgi:L-lactate dehydrogenase (cytochrome)
MRNSDMPRGMDRSSADLEATPVKGIMRTPPTALPRRLRKILALDDFEVAARRHLPRPIFG